MSSTKELILYKDFENGKLFYDFTWLIENYDNDYYNKEARNDENTSISELIIAKHRNGPTATIELLFKKNTSTFLNIRKEGNMGAKKEENSN